MDLRKLSIILYIDLLDLNLIVSALKVRRYVNNTLSKTIIQRITDVRARHIVIHDTKVNNNHEKNLIIESLVNNLPAYINNFDLWGSHSIYADTDKKRTRIFQPRYNTLHIIVFQNHFKEFFINFVFQSMIGIAAKSHGFSRPKLLVILIGSFTEIEKSANLDLLLDVSWQEGFIDTTFIETETLQSGTYLYLNPFFHKIHRYSLTSESNIFPGKLRNVNRHVFSIPLNKATMSYKVDSRGQAYNLTHPNYEIFKMFAEYFNFEIKFVFNPRTGEKNDRFETVALYTGHATAKLTPQSIDEKIDQFKSENSDATGCHEYVVYVPRLETAQFKHILFEIFCETSCIYFILLCFAKLMQKLEKHHYINNRHYNWTMDNCLKFVLGIPSKFYPRNSRDKILYSAFFVLSVTIICDFVASFTNARIEHSQVYFGSYEELDESDLDILSIVNFFKIAQGDKNDTFYRLSKKTKGFVYFHEDKHEIPNKPFIFIGSKDVYNDINKYIEERNGTNFLVPSPMVLSTGISVYKFAKGKPFVRMFNHFQKMYTETGLYDYHEKVVLKSNATILPKMAIEDEDVHIMRSQGGMSIVLTIVFATGIAVALLALWIEIILESRTLINEDLHATADPAAKSSKIRERKNILQRIKDKRVELKKADGMDRGKKAAKVPRRAVRPVEPPIELIDF